jgi:hypothetical protein
MKIYLRQRPKTQAVQQLKKKNRKLENVLIVKLITWQHALCNYHYYLKHTKDMTTEELTEVQKRSKK